MFKPKKTIAHFTALAFAISAGTATMTAKPQEAHAFAFMAALPILEWLFDHRETIGNMFGTSTAEAATTSGSGGTTRTAQMVYQQRVTSLYRYYQTADGIRLNCDVNNSQMDAQNRTSYYCTTQNNTQAWFAQTTEQPQTQQVAQQDLVCLFNEPQSNGSQTVYPCEDQRTRLRGWYAAG